MDIGDAPAGRLARLKGSGVRPDPSRNGTIPISINGRGGTAPPQLNRCRTMIIRIDRTAPGRFSADGHILFDAVGEDGSPMLVQIDQTAWDSIRDEWSHDPLSGVEEVARQGHWAESDNRRVWRIDFV